MTAPLPIRNLARRMPRHGKIKIGEMVKMANGKSRPASIPQFRFTSGDKGAIAAIADLYGGTPGPWNGQWEVKTDAAEIPIALPPDPLGGTPMYELWDGGGLQRRCDGEVCELPSNGPEGPEMAESPCLCVAKDKLECTVKTRLTVVLREIAFGGGWMLETGGWNAAHELPGMVDAVQAIQARGFVSAILAVEQRTSKKAGKTRHFVVPVVRPAVTLDALAAGEGGVGSLPPPALPSPPTIVDHDGDPVEVDEVEMEQYLTCNLCGEEVKGFNRAELKAAAVRHTEMKHP